MIYDTIDVIFGTIGADPEDFIDYHSNVEDNQQLLSTTAFIRCTGWFLGDDMM